MNIKTEIDTTGFAPQDSLWTAIDDDTYCGEGCHMGRGKTQQDAVSDLLEQFNMESS